MVDRDNEPPSPGTSGGLSADEADRLAERFRPSWEKDDGASSSRRAAKQTLIGIAPLSSAPPASTAAPPSVAPVSPRPNSISSAAASPHSSLPPRVLPQPPTRSSRPEGELEKPVARERPIGKQTLIGIAPIQGPPPARKEGTDDLPAPAVPGAAAAPISPRVAAPKSVTSPADLPPPPPIPAELSSRQTTGASLPAPMATSASRPAAAERSLPPVTIEPPNSHSSEPPRGIVAPYQPKDDPSGPAVVLKDDVLAMEEAQAAREEVRREHATSSRRAPTVMNLKAPASAYPAPDFAPKRSKAPLILVGGILVGLAAVAVVALVSGSKEKGSPVPATSTASPPLATTPQADPEPARDAPPPPPEAPAARASTPESEGLPRAAATNPKPAPKKPLPKVPAKTGSKPVSGTTSPAPKKGGVIVRDTPF
jgi:hypothetical protein